MKKIDFAKPIIGRHEKKGIYDILKSGNFVHGKYTHLFEKNFQKFIGSNIDLTSTSSCTAAMHLFYMCMKLKKGDEIIVPSMSHVATAHAVSITGAKPIFIDSNEEDGNINIELIEKHINEKTKGICVTHFLGKPLNLDKLIKIKRKYNLFLLEDCALALGSYYKNKHVGSMSDGGAFSFHPVKLITTAEGGMLIGKNKKIVKKVKSLKSFGYDIADPLKRRIPGNYNINYLGLNYRMNEIEASLGVEQLKKIHFFLKQRQNNFNFLHEELRKIKNLKILKTYSYNNYISSYYAMGLVIKNKKKFITPKIKKKRH